MGLAPSLELLNSIVDFIIGMFKDTLAMVRMGVKILAQIPSLLSWIPGEFYSLIALIIAVVFLYKILGREG